MAHINKCGKIVLPGDVRYIIRKLQESGFEAYAVGGCVRDSLIGRKPDDWDITTNALPGQVKSCFKRTVDTGIEHGTVTVILKDRENGKLSGYEVTTYRIDGAYKDGRHPENVTFTPSLKEDLRRRDFTVNAMAYNDSAGLVDEFEGISDLREKIIRCVGNPDERFDEDALRILRAVRFAAQLGFIIDRNTENAILGHAENLKNISKERIQTELTKLLCSANPQMIRDVRRLGMGPYICKGFEAVNIDVFCEAAKGLGLSTVPSGERHVRYALLLAGMDKKSVQMILRDLKLDNDTVNKASVLAENIFRPVKADRYEIKKLTQKIGRELSRELFELKSKLFESGVSCYTDRCSERIESVKEIYEDIEARNEPVFLKELAVKGADLIALGENEGPCIGRTLSAMLEEVLKHPENNIKSYLIEKFCLKGKEA